MTDWNFSNPPVWEAGIGVSTQQPTLYDHFDVASVHKLFSDKFPRAERQPPMPGLELFPGANAPIAVPELRLEIAGPSPARWWFSSVDGHNLVQLQDNFFSRNWRRTDISPAPKQHYPNFEGLLEDFKVGVQALIEINRKSDRDTPPPRLCDILYVNHLEVTREDGSRRRFREMLPWLAFNEEILKARLAVGWLEKIEGSSLTLEVQMNHLGMQMPDPAQQVLPLIRLSFNARGPCETWEAAYELAGKAHARMRERLLSLTSDELQATWGM